MKSHTVYKTFNTRRRRELVRLTDEVAQAVRESGIDRKALGGRTIWIRDAQSDRGFQYSAEAKKEKIRSVLVTPLLVGKKSIGVLRAYTQEERKFDRQEIRFLEAVANLSAIAMDNARLYNALKTNFDLLVEHKYRIDDN